jgi:lipooligosaccharide transport system permease protein
MPGAILSGMAVAAPVAAYTATAQTDYGLSSIMRFGVMPAFLLSGTFFPVDQLPVALGVVARVLPLWHGVVLCRSFSLGRAELLGSLGHVAYLALWIAAGTVLTVFCFRRRLVT